MRGRQDGRTVEIQRFIGRSLRAVVDMAALGDRTVYIDCDVIEADGGTRCVAVSGGYLALHLALKRAVDARALRALPLIDSVAAVSVGVVGGMPVLDLEYEEDCVADVDMNVVMTGNGRFIEVQATAETEPFERARARRAAGVWPNRASDRSRKRRWNWSPGRMPAGGSGAMSERTCRCVVLGHAAMPARLGSSAACWPA